MSARRKLYAMDDHSVRALYDEKTIRVYQAYSDHIANEAIRLGTFGPSFKLDRMTWIKPSFLWMMYRCGWATKEGQSRVLAIDMRREGFDSIVSSAVLSTFSESVYGTHENWQACLGKSDVRCQWDPDRDIYGNPLSRRTIQLGIKGDMVRRYVHDWIVQVTDLTTYAVDLRSAIASGTFNAEMLPLEREYSLTE